MKGSTTKVEIGGFVEREDGVGIEGRASGG